ncbi:hypothetical protein [Pseudanabaena sp. FACHB-2040]|uniref:hypothetical protein n=1 Tax=Pseudanabaena sp. FACHB-2040 TaxID=2692859 RepID=UPI0016840CFD|nr:hypothetical protein [Pseudanabaena sp. FACHB-2040]MBD2257752.1 hypothetical protein [Pseudanabaena sp. FACHB-2040]
MAKHTQAHMSRTVPKSQSEFTKQRTRSQMEYYMGAKLIEVGVNPKSAIYRWATEDKGSNEVWTYSAYWGDSREKIEAEESLT